eukprot:2473871-Rhodomonas_salina.2
MLPQLAAAPDGCCRLSGEARRAAADVSQLINEKAEDAPVVPSSSRTMSGSLMNANADTPSSESETGMPTASGSPSPPPWAAGACCE